MFEMRLTYNEKIALTEEEANLRNSKINKARIYVFEVILAAIVSVIPPRRYKTYLRKALFVGDIVLLTGEEAIQEVTDLMIETLEEE